MASSSRRSLLRGSAVGMLVPLVGCQFSRNESPDSRDAVFLCKAGVENLVKSSAHDVRIQILDGDEVRYETAKTLAPYREDGWISVVTAEDFDSPRGAFVFRVRVDGGDWSTFDLTTISPTDAGAVAATAIITDGGTISFLESDDDSYDCKYLPTEDGGSN
ncbi:MAG TPA: hypothetical protein VJ898_05265 [Natrialbaceae archaeon]|nr:hypothetical protein [Natrialbaceae archaeon]